MSQLLGLCPEVLHAIFQEVNPEDLASLSKTCRLLNLVVKNDGLLWKDVYLRNYDHYLIAADQTEPCWRTELQKLVILKKLLQSSDIDVKRAQLSEVAKTAMDLLRTTSTKSKESLNANFLANLFESQENIDIFLCSSSLFKHAGPVWATPAPTETERQLSAKLHVLYGPLSVEPSAPDARPIHPYARSRVYDLRKYQAGNFWGPFLDDDSGNVDWEKLQCIMVLLGHNLRTFAQRTHGHFGTHREKAFLGTAANSFTSTPSCPSHAAMMVKELTPPLAALDPYGVTGTWRRVVCFLDYTDLYSFNFEPLLPEEQEHGLIDTQEAIRLITLKIRVTAIEGPGPHDAQNMPVVHFTGTSRSMHTSWDPNANSKIRGSVRTTPEGAIRWTSFSIYHGEERWRSEGVQIGGIRSARGVLGTWFDKDYDRHGPAGPTGFWKLSDDIEVDKVQHSIISFVEI